jgi:polysaccharide export outer membrane protein
MHLLASQRARLTGIVTLGLLGALLLTLTAGARPLAAQSGAGGGLQPGDAVRLKIWREPEMSGDFQVDERGEVVFPRIGPMRVSHLGADSLKTLLVATYTTYLRDPSIEVSLLRRVNVLGAVRNPGLYQVDQTQTLADVLAQAGGATPDGKPDRVELLRDGVRTGIRLQKDTRLFGSAVHSGDQLWVPQRSWFSRNSGPLIGAGITATVVIITTLIAR